MKPMLAAGKRVEYFYIQDAGGTSASIAKGAAIARSMLSEVYANREPCNISDLTVALECGVPIILLVLLLTLL